ncbi:TrkH family potassium uptake protein [Peribacillus acanthi]|uniref:TrkH family potassium uptake protein n=1 Tax=Peribacillus acanthi TaxID=2171554 RepID=UPI000D3E236B|nr:TrkH family potassium uptake protein [Peribacillus acanthi]
MKWRTINLSPPQLLILLFLIFQLLGTGLLMLPVATVEPIHWIDAFFTITSAMTVTGLVVFDTGTIYTTFGEVIIMLWIQLGGLGIMSFAVLVFIMLGKKIGFKERILIQQSLNQTSLGGVILLVKRLFLFSFIIEGIAMACLATRWVPEFGWGKGLYFSLFHSISAFNNAGFGLLPDNMMRYVGDPVINIVITFLFIVGGIGFTVLVDMWVKPSFRKLSLHSKLMIIGTLVLNSVAMIIIFLLEKDNPGTMGKLSGMEKFWASYFQAVSPRTAGFNSIDLVQLKDPTAFFMMLLMFVGAGSASTGGGIKLTTFLVIIFAVIMHLQGKNKMVIRKRTIDISVVYKSLSIATISVLFVFLSIFILSITEKADFVTIIFEVISAFGTVGLSMGLTYELTWIGKIVIIFTMFLGKVGPLTLAFTLAKPKTEKVGYPTEDILAG